MPKSWQIMPKIDQTFINQFSQYDPILLQLLFNRGLIEPKEIEDFLSSDYSLLHHDPFLFRDMEAATDLIIEKIKAGEKIVVYGDYDADGVTSSAILIEVLKILKAKTDIYIPNRVSEGYGLNKSAIKESSKAGAKLIITVDNGIRNKAEVEYVKSLGMEIIITDHHVPPPEKNELPDCLIINPIIQDETYPFKYLAGVGVASKLALALIKKSKLTEEQKIKLENKILDLVAIGTVADCVTLLGENRILVKQGLEVLNKTNRLGLKELFKTAKINEKQKLDSWNIGFQISPRLNAAGRMDHANTAYELLTTKDRDEAVKLSEGLNLRNQDRQKITEEIVKEIIDNQIKEPLKNKIIIAVSPSIYEKSQAWNEGIIGLVAGRICEKYYLPTLVITGNSKDIKGSGRSIEEFNLIKTIEHLKNNLFKYGGHAAACGFSIEGKEKLENFIKEITEYANSNLGTIELKPKLSIDAEIDFNDVNDDLIEILEKLMPFGEDNDRPVFVCRNVNVVDIMNMGIDGRHLKLKLRADNSKTRNALGFGQAEEWKAIKINDRIDIAFYADLNEFNGRREVQLKIIDIKLLE